MTVTETGCPATPPWELVYAVQAERVLAWSWVLAGRQWPVASTIAPRRNVEPEAAPPAVVGEPLGAAVVGAAPVVGDAAVVGADVLDELPQAPPIVTSTAAATASRRPVAERKPT